MNRHIDLHGFFAETFDLETMEYTPRTPKAEQPSLFTEEEPEEDFLEQVFLDEDTVKEEPKKDTYMDLLDEF